MMIPKLRGYFVVLAVGIWVNHVAAKEGYVTCGNSGPTHLWTETEEIQEGPSQAERTPPANTGTPLVVSNATYRLEVDPRGRVCSLVLDPVEYDAWFLGTQTTDQVRGMAARLYAHLADDFDFILFINNENVNPGGYSGRHYGVQNDVLGIGSGLFDNTAAYGSSGRLQSAIHLRTRSNLRGGPSLHEISHRWANRLTLIPNAGAHWGFSSAGGQLGGWRPGTLVDLGSGRYDADGFNGSSSFGTVANGGNGLPYSEIEIYLMGLLSSDSVADLQVAVNGAWENTSQGIFIASAINPVSITDIVADEGVRIPDISVSPKAFRAVAILLTPEPLTPTVWDAMDRDVASFELEGDDGSTLFNFWEATGGRATIQLAGLLNSMQPGIDGLILEPNQPLVATGLEGTMLAPTSMAYTIRNLSTNAVSWAATTAESWLQISPTSGVLAGGATAPFSVQLDASAHLLAAGAYSNVVQIANTVTSVYTQIAAELVVGTVANMPFFDGFESGAFDTYWELGGTEEHRIALDASQTPVGMYQVILDDHTNSGSISLNELMLTIDLAGWTNVMLQFMAKEFSDEAHPPPASPFTGSALFDGIAIRTSHLTTDWHVVQALTALSGEFQLMEVNLDTAVAEAGIEYSSTFQILFSQYDNSSAPYDGIGLDNIQLSGVETKQHLGPILLTFDVVSNLVSLTMTTYTTGMYQVDMATNTIGVLSPEWNIVWGPSPGTAVTMSAEIPVTDVDTAIFRGVREE